ncbi:hypothetical protein BDW22DRAFT_462822 [Trametopsis cervina]|nr:hypothetical protein BDW22DRAFT_462822 [Trametopsis cervina]
MQRPGPLRDLPLERFVSEVNNSHTGSPSKLAHSRIHKRPASPGVLYHAPHKRRLLDERGAALASAAPWPGTATVAHSSSLPGGFVNAHRTVGTGGESSYERQQLDIFADVTRHYGGFDASSSAPRWPSAYPQPASTSNATTGSATAHMMVTEDIDAEDLVEHRSQSLVSFAVPQQSIGCYDPESIHYPGFVVYYDPDGIPQYGSSDENAFTSGAVSSRSSDKENLPPQENPLTPRYSKKDRMLTTPTPRGPWEKGRLSRLSETPSSNSQNDSIPITPLARSLQFASLSQSPFTPTPKLGLGSSLGAPFMASATPTRAGKSELVKLRRQLTDEADGIDGFDVDGLF